MFARIVVKPILALSFYFAIRIEFISKLMPGTMKPLISFSFLTQVDTFKV